MQKNLKEVVSLMYECKKLIREIQPVVSLLIKSVSLELSLLLKCVGQNLFLSEL